MDKRNSRWQGRIVQNNVNRFVSKVYFGKNKEENNNLERITTTYETTIEY